ncbi:GlsB/YeaQ/YmgE family stress response membrane protein [Pyxidicoccus trucidator]|uniref:GlsB/YeaQ/YmgE family stress response membrane protein n=1 Tax=Pyxidicoccus trucidator TaxID=2709662 RepID=UPI001F080978|nr:GlsB/YeaQ/YmgE family stress response membrane protein [Pyxidicoccus trucidator]
MVKLPRALSPWLAVLVLSGPGASWGQQAPQEEPGQAPASELTPPPLVPIPPPGTADAKPAPEGAESGGEDAPTPSVSEQALPGRAAVPPKDPVPRVAMEVVGGTAGGLIAGTVGLAAGYVLALPTVGCDECRVVALVGGFTGVLMGIPAGTWLGGRLMGGKGQFLATAGGSLVGWGGALLGSLLLSDAADSDALALALLVMPIAGATAGYELSNPSERPPAVPRASERVRVLPVAGMTERGPRLGLMGRF